MNEHNGSPKSPARAVARSMGELVHDAVTLADLQLRLFKIEIESWSRDLIASVTWLLVALCVAVGCIPVLLLSLANVFVEYGGLSQSLSLFTAALVGLTVSAIAAAIGLRILRNNGNALERSQEEFNRNLKWFKQMLDQESHSTPLQNRSSRNVL